MEKTDEWSIDLPEVSVVAMPPPKVKKRGVTVRGSDKQTVPVTAKKLSQRSMEAVCKTLVMYASCQYMHSVELKFNGKFGLTLQHAEEVYKCLVKAEETLLYLVFPQDPTTLILKNKDGVYSKFIMPKSSSSKFYVPKEYEPTVFEWKRKDRKRKDPPTTAEDFAEHSVVPDKENGRSDPPTSSTLPTKRMKSINDKQSATTNNAATQCMVPERLRDFQAPDPSPSNVQVGVEGIKRESNTCNNVSTESRRDKNVSNSNQGTPTSNGKGMDAPGSGSKTNCTNSNTELDRENHSDGSTTVDLLGEENKTESGRNDKPSVLPGDIFDKPVDEIYAPNIQDISPDSTATSHGFFSDDSDEAGY